MIAKKFRINYILDGCYSCAKRTSLPELMLKGVVCVGYSGRIALARIAKIFIGDPIKARFELM